MIEWNLNKPLKQNLQKNHMRFVFPKSNYFEPWSSPELNRYFKYDIMCGRKYISLSVDDDDICPLLHPDNPSAVYFQTGLLKEDFSFRLKIELTEELPVKLLCLRNVADILNKDLLSICYDDNRLSVQHLGLSRLVIPYNIDEGMLDIKLQVYKNHIYMDIDDFKLNLDATMDDDYWCVFGLVNTPCKTYNNIRIYDIRGL